MSIPGLLLKNQLRSYRKLLSKGWPLTAALLVFILLVAGEARPLVANQELLSTYLPLIYAAIFLFIAGRRILFLKYPPFFFSLPGLYFFLTTPVNHRLVLAGKILRSYLPLFLYSFGWSVLAGPARTGLPGGASLFFCLAATANISWLLYNAATNRILLRKVLIFLAVILLLVLKTPGFFWPMAASFFPAAVLSYLAVVKGVFRPAFSGWFATGALLFTLLFSCIYSAFWGEAFAVLLLLIPYVVFSGRRMKGIYEGVDPFKGRAGRGEK